MSEGTTGGAPSAAPSAAPAAAESSNSSVAEGNLPGVGSIDQGVQQALDQANADATVNKTQKTVEKKAQDAVEQVLEDFATTWKNKKGKETLKVNGKTREVNDYNDMVKLAQLGLAANEKFQQASDKIKQAEAIVELLQTQPEKALEKLGFNVRQMAEEYLKAELQKEMMSPEQQKMWEMEQRLAKYEEEKKGREDVEKQNKMIELQRHYENELTDKIIKAIDTYKLPKNEKTISRMAEKLYVALESGYEIDPLDIAPLIKQEIDEELRGFVGNLDVEALLSVLQEDGLKKIRNYEVNRAKAKAPETPLKTTPVATVDPQADAKAAPKKSAKDYFAELEKKYK